MYFQWGNGRTKRSEASVTSSFCTEFIVIADDCWRRFRIVMVVNEIIEKNTKRLVKKELYGVWDWKVCVAIRGLEKCSFLSVIGLSKRTDFVGKKL